MNFKKIAAFGLGLMILGLSVATPAQAAVDRAIIEGVASGSDYSHVTAYAHYMDGGTGADVGILDIPLAGIATDQDLINTITSSVNTYASGHGYTLTNGIIWSFLTPSQVTTMIASATSSVTAAYTSAITAAIPAGPSSYQTIVSQTGTAAPAVAGGMTPVNNYSGTPTFTWARTGTGVYTLTASSAVFNTSGKTGVFITPPQNLNGSFRAVVTSSTVITVTTAVQSLAVLGLLGFTATPTDALLSGTMVYVQTYP